VLEQLRTVASQRPTYGYRRLWALLNRLRQRQGLRRINAKRVYRLAKGYRLLLQRLTGTPPVRVHDGVIAVERSDERYCSDGLRSAVTMANGCEWPSASIVVTAKRSLLRRPPPASAASSFGM